MKRWISLLLLVSLVLSLLCFPAAAQTDDSQGITLQYLTGPVFSQHHNGGWVPLCISGDYALFSATGRSVSILDMFGKTINNKQIDEFTCVSPGIYYLRLLGASYGALCRGATPFTISFPGHILAEGFVRMATSRNSLSRNGTRPSTPHAERLLLARRQS